jgi:hypothetical protein
MAAKKLLEVPGVVAIEADEDGTDLRIDAVNGAAEPLTLQIPISPAEARELASNLRRWADAVESPSRLARID